MMGRKKNPTKHKLSSDTSTKMSLEDENIEETTSSNLDESMCELDESIVGGDKTSADYYFDSYSHFGIHEVGIMHLAVVM